MKTKIQILKEQINNLTDPRRTSHGNIRHKLEDIIIIGLRAIIRSGEDYADMEAFGTEREKFPHGFHELPHGIPDSDTFRRLFERLDPEALSECLVDWLDVELPDRRVIVVDGKTIRESADNTQKAYHVVSAFVAENQITLGEIAVDEKSNEITAVPDLLDPLYIDNAIITADSMSRPKKIVRKIAGADAGYCIALKAISRCCVRMWKNILMLMRGKLSHINI